MLLSPKKGSGIMGRLIRVSTICMRFFSLNMGWLGGAMVRGKQPVPGRPTIWITVGKGPIALAVGAGGGCLDILLSAIFPLLFLPLSWRRPDID